MTAWTVSRSESKSRNCMPAVYCLIASIAKRISQSRNSQFLGGTNGLVHYALPQLSVKGLINIVSTGSRN